MWSFVGSKRQQRWLWHAIDHHTGQVLAYVFGTREDETFLRLQELLAPFGITHFYTDGWGAYRRHIDLDKHTVGKQHTQKIERKHTTLRARIKRLVIGKYLSCLCKLDHGIIFKAGFEAQLRASCPSISCGMRASGMTRQIRDGRLQRGIQPRPVSTLQGLDQVA